MKKKFKKMKILKTKIKYIMIINFNKFQKNRVRIDRIATRKM